MRSFGFGGGRERERERAGESAGEAREEGEKEERKLALQLGVEELARSKERAAQSALLFLSNSLFPSSTHRVPRFPVYGLPDGAIRADADLSDDAVAVEREWGEGEGEEEVSQIGRKKSKITEGGGHEEREASGTARTLAPAPPPSPCRAPNACLWYRNGSNDSKVPIHGVLTRRKFEPDALCVGTAPGERMPFFPSPTRKRKNETAV